MLLQVILNGMSEVSIFKIISIKNSIHNDIKYKLNLNNMILFFSRFSKLLHLQYISTACNITAQIMYLSRTNHMLYINYKSNYSLEKSYFSDNFRHAKTCQTPFHRPLNWSTGISPRRTLARRKKRSNKTEH